MRVMGTIPAVVVVPANGPRGWQVDAVKRAERAGTIRVEAVLHAAAAAPRTLFDATIAALGGFETLASPASRRRRTLRARCEARREWAYAEHISACDGEWPLAIDLTTAPGVASAERTVWLQIGNAPDIEDVIDAQRTGRGTVTLRAQLAGSGGSTDIATAIAGVRERTLVVASLELLLARASLVLTRGIERACQIGDIGDQAWRGDAQAPRLSWRHAIGFVGHTVRDYARTLRERVGGLPIWFLAYRDSRPDFVAATLSSSPRGFNVVMPPAGRFYADPCVFRHDEVDHVFFEDYDGATRRGGISWMRRLPDGSFSRVERVLERPYHLSYPFVFAHSGDVYMIPETAEMRCVELYRAVEFPRVWERTAVLLEDVHAVDATVVEHDRRWWMFANVAEDASSTCDELFIYYADSLFGPWQPHAANPVKSDVRSARPAGRLFHRGDRLIRPAQNCSRTYGGSLVLCEVLELTPTAYREQVIADLAPPSIPGNSRFHTLSFSERLEVIDGNGPASLRRWRPAA